MSTLDFSSPREAARAFTPKLSQFIDATLYPQFWAGPALAPRERSLITVAALIAGGHADELPAHLKRAVDNGVTAEELAAAITQVMGVVGGGAYAELARIDYKTQDFAEVIAQHTEGRGVDVIIDFIGEPCFARNLASLANGGRLVQVGILAGGGEVTLKLEDLLYRHLRLIGTVMKSRTQPEKHAMVRRFREHWLERFDGAARLEPVVDSTYPLAAAADAHRRMESANNVGKIILATQASGLY